MDLLDLIDERRTARTPTGKSIREPRSTFIYDIVKTALEPCPECGNPMNAIKVCQSCEGSEENP